MSTTNSSTAIASQKKGSRRHLCLRPRVGFYSFLSSLISLFRRFITSHAQTVTPHPTSPTPSNNDTKNRCRAVWYVFIYTVVYQQHEGARWRALTDGLETYISSPPQYFYYYYFFPALIDDLLLDYGRTTITTISHHLHINTRTTNWGPSASRVPVLFIYYQLQGSQMREL